MSMRRADKPYQRAGRNGWWVTVYNEHGKRRRLNAGETYEEAVVFRSEYIADVKDITSNRVTRRQIEVAEASKLDVQVAIDAWIDEVSGHATPSHVKECRRYVERFTSQAKIFSLADVTTPVVKRWLSRQKSRDHSLRRLRQWCRWCVDMHRMTDDPTSGIPMQSNGPERPAGALSIEQASALAATCKCPKRKARYLLGMRQGLRVNEVGRLQWKHIDFEGGWIRLDRKITKMKRNDDLPLDDAVREALVAIRPDIVNADAKIFKAGVTNYTWKRDLARAGIIRIVGLLQSRKVIDKKTGKKKRLQADAELVGYEDEQGNILSMQCLRKTFGTHLVMAGVDQSHVMKLMRHTDASLTMQLYVKARLMNLASAQSQLPTLLPANRCQLGASKGPISPDTEQHQATG